MEITELKELAALVQRHTDADGEYRTALPKLTLFRSSAPTDHDAVVYVPSLCVIVQGAKEVVVGGEAYRYDPAHSLLVSVDLPAATRIVEASPGRPCLAIRIEIDSADVAEFLAIGTTVPPAAFRRGASGSRQSTRRSWALSRDSWLYLTPRTTLARFHL